MKKRSIFLNVALISLVIMVCIIIVYLLSTSIYILKNGKNPYYTIGKDKIPSIYKVNGKRNLYYYRSYKKDNNKIKVFKYKNVSDVKSDLTNYINELRDNYNYKYTSDVDLNSDDSFELSNNSSESDQIIIINIKYTDTSYTIKITKGPGDIKIY